MQKWNGNHQKMGLKQMAFLYFRETVIMDKSARRRHVSTILKVWRVGEATENRPASR